MNSGRRRDAVDYSRTGWRKSSRSSANCVEVNTGHPALVHLRDS